MQGRHGRYFYCNDCHAIFMSPDSHLSDQQEKECYGTHFNDVKDIRYQEFVSPIVHAVGRDYQAGLHRGLDFGCGTGPVISFLLQKKGFDISLYDPFFHNTPQALDKKYDFIVCCEVIEHFHHPKEEFQLLHSLLLPGGKLYCMTELYSEDIDFDHWNYKNCPTHVFFYSLRTLNRLKTMFDFKKLTVRDRLIIFEKGHSSCGTLSP